jgi:branched-chain amino acid transport system substrate-binding protein
MRNVTVLVLVGCLTGCWGGAPPEPLPVGHVVPMSGPEEFAGERARQGLLLALEDLNNEEKLAGQRPVRVQHADGRNAPAAATRLIKIDRVAAVLDTTDPTQVLGLATTANGTETPLMTVSPLPRIPQNEYAFSLTPSPSQQGTVLAQFALGRDDLKQSVVQALGDGRVPASAAIIDAFSREFTKGGGRVGPGPGPFTSDDELAERLVQLKKAAPPVVLFSGTARHLARTAALLHESSPSTTVLFAGDEGALLALSSAGPTGKVFVMTAFHADGLTPAGQEFAKAFKARFGRDLDVNAALAVDGVRLLADALRKTKTAAPGVRKELAELADFDSLTGPLSFTREGCARRPLFVVEVQDGKPADQPRRFEAEPK